MKLHLVRMVLSVKSDSMGLTGLGLRLVPAEIRLAEILLAPR